MQQNLPTPKSTAERSSPSRAIRSSSSIEHLRAASLIKSPAHRVNAEPITPASGNFGSTPRAVSPVQRTGKSYAAVVTKVPSPPPQPPTDAIATHADGPAQTVPAVEPTVVPACSATTLAASAQLTPVVVKTEEVDASLTTNHPEDEGWILATKTIKATRQRGKKANNLGRMQPAGQDDDTASLRGPSNVALPALGPATQRAASDTRKRRRVSSDTGGNTADAGTTTRVQASPPPPPAIAHRDEPIEVSSSPDSAIDNDPPALTTSDLEPEDVEMRGPEEPSPTAACDVHHAQSPAISRQTYGTPLMVRRYLEQQSSRFHNMPPAARDAYNEGDIEDLYTPAGSPAPRPERDPPPHLARRPTSSAPLPHAAPPAANRGAAPANAPVVDGRDDVLWAQADGPPIAAHAALPPAPPLPMPQLPAHPPAFAHPHPVHFAPGPFPVALAGPAQPIAQAHGLPPPSAMTRAPKDGWLAIQGDFVMWPLKNVKRSQAAEWSADPDSYVLLHFPGQSASDKRGHRTRLRIADTILKKWLGTLKAKITQPLPEVPSSKPNSDPVYFRVGNITPPERARLIDNPWASTVDGTVGIVPPPQHPPTFMGAWLNPERLGETEDEVTAGFVEGFLEEDIDEMTRSMLVTEIRDDGRWGHLTFEEAHNAIISSIWTRQITVHEDRDDPDGEPVVLLYVESPTSDEAEWKKFRNRVRAHAFGNLLAGPPELVTKAYYCMYCHSIDHPTDACSLPNTPGWHGPSLKEAREALAEERRSREAEQRAQGNNGGGRGGRGGRDGRARGSNNRGRRTGAGGGRSSYHNT
ncbi:uncharacterized protein B0H18DRAFT_957235 [Fomitopsis serialis]|uniref:uncharacterized protein n=1 Tax=Fomitopsis serialis TaxID=139415 RepID=UPI002007B2B9|nr:uncharacterized protein B0H18DRAFT_957235 [Neoantrodia serialis]KAH9920049.1 hypothetical protein B0H18DRAFT_957235 [Neoantrodia serialis]